MSSMQDPAPKVVITGLGIISPIGIGIDAFRASLMEGRSGVHKLKLVNYSPAPDQVGAEVSDFEDETARKLFTSKVLKKNVKVMCREIAMGAASSEILLEHSGLDLSAVDRDRMGVEFGSNLMLSPPEILSSACWKCTDEELHFHFEEWGDKGLRAMEPLWLLKYLPNMPACHIGIAADARGPNNSITLDDASGNLVVSEATRIIKRGHADIMIAGVTGTRLSPVKSIHAAMWDELATGEGDPATWCKPFDRNRTGQVIAEGACSILLESEENARSRGATIWGEVLGAGASCVVDQSGHPNRTKALVNAMKAAFRDAGLSPQDIGHINAHGLGSRLSDQEEAAAIVQVFGDSPQVPVTSLKSYLGNSGAGAGCLEMAGSLVALREGLIPMTLNYQTPDPGCPLNVVHGRHQSTTSKIFMKLNVTRIGQASAIIVSVP